MAQPKQFGLIKLNKNDTKKPQNTLKTVASAFGADDSDSDGGEVPTVVVQSKGPKRADLLKISQAIEEDPNVFQYDELYDDMKGKDDVVKTKVQSKPKYITNMMKTAERRTKEHELVAERKIHREREKEGDMFKDKEVFVTGAYRQKLEENKKTQLELERQDRIESMLDVTKQNDLSGFYRNLYQHNMVAPTDEQKEESKIAFNKKQAGKRQLRERDTNEDEEEEEPVVIKRDRNDEETTITPAPSESQPSETENAESEKPQEASKSEEESKKPAVESEPIEPPKPKPDRMTVIRQLFTKRTVGEAFDDAQKRFFERKALRSM